MRWWCGRFTGGSYWQGILIYLTREFVYIKFLVRFTEFCSCESPPGEKRALWAGTLVHDAPYHRKKFPSSQHSTIPV